jgi:hypothetical protein
MGAALSSAGDRLSAGRAFEAALAVNFYRMRAVGENVTSPELQLAIYNVRRVILSAALGNADFSAISKEQSRLLLLRVIETKGLGIRYSERFNRLLSSASSQQAQTARQELQTIESQMAATPDGIVGLYRFFELSVQRMQLFRPVMAELQAAGLGEIFQDGETLLKQVRTTLGEGALIGYMAYTPLSSEKYEFAPARYLRYCVTSNEVQLIDIGAKSTIDRSFFNLRQAILNGKSTAKFDRALSQNLLGELPHSANVASKWTIEPDGVLNLLPFEALSFPDDRPVITTVDVGYVTSFGQIASTSVSTTWGKSRIIADPEFGTSSTRNRPPPKGKTRASVAVVLKGRSVESIEVPSLSETRAEAKAVGTALDKLGFQSETFLGKRADVQALKTCQSPRILHVATHGILIAPQLLPEQTQVDTLIQAESVNLALPGRNAALVLSGKGKPELVYASEIANLPLQNTELVVLSACDTGNGTVDVGEGMASLRRAVESAGAAASITSLWSVPSAKTTELMSSFYGYLAKGHGKRASLRLAKLDAIAIDPSPYHWAGFVFAGQE